MAEVQSITPRKNRPPSSTGIADADLVAAAKEGDRWASDALYRRYVGPVGGMATRLLASMPDAEDVVHDAFLKAFQKLHTLREPERFRSWLFRIAVTEARMALRKKRVRSLVGLHLVEDATLALLAAKEIDGETRAELARLDDVLGTMPAIERIAWMLRHVEGQTLEEVAEHSGCSLATVKRRLRAASGRIERHACTAAHEGERR